MHYPVECGVHIWVHSYPCSNAWLEREKTAQAVGEENHMTNQMFAYTLFFVLRFTAFFLLSNVYLIFFSMSLLYINYDNANWETYCLQN